jgi:hypothetical protein
MQRTTGGSVGGSLGLVVLGIVMAGAGGYLFLDRVTVIGTSWRLFGMNGFGLTLVPLLFGVFLLFLNGRSILGWVLTIAGTGIIFFGVLSNLDIFFRPTSLYVTLLILVLLLGGIALVVRGLRSA